MVSPWFATVPVETSVAGLHGHRRVIMMILRYLVEWGVAIFGHFRSRSPRDRRRAGSARQLYANVISPFVRGNFRNPAAPSAATAAPPRRKKRVRILGADHFPQRAFRCARQLQQPFDWNFGHGRLILAEPLDGVPRHRKGSGVLDVNVRFQHLAVLDQVEALDDVKLRGVRGAESVNRSAVIESDGVNHQGVAFVMADGLRRTMTALHWRNACW